MLSLCGGLLTCSGNAVELGLVTCAAVVAGSEAACFCPDRPVSPWEALLQSAESLTTAVPLVMGGMLARCASLRDPESGMRKGSSALPWLLPLAGSSCWLASMPGASWGSGAGEYSCGRSWDGEVACCGMPSSSMCSGPSMGLISACQLGSAVSASLCSEPAPLCSEALTGGALL